MTLVLFPMEKWSAGGEGKEYEMCGRWKGCKHQSGVEEESMQKDRGCRECKVTHKMYHEVWGNTWEREWERLFPKKRDLVQSRIRPI